MKIGNIIQEERIKKGLSLRQLAELSGVGFAHISKIENGHKCSIDTLEKILRELGLELTVKAAE